MAHHLKYQQEAINMINQSPASWFTLKDVQKNLESAGFLITEVEDLREPSRRENNYLFATYDDQYKLISLNASLANEKKKTMLIDFYNYYQIVSQEKEEGFILTYYHHINGKQGKYIRTLRRSMIELSAMKELLPEKFGQIFALTEEGRLLCK